MKFEAQENIGTIMKSNVQKESSEATLHSPIFSQTQIVQDISFNQYFILGTFILKSAPMYALDILYSVNLGNDFIKIPIKELKWGFNCPESILLPFQDENDISVFLD
jgi:hypothetical protein